MFRAGERRDSPLTERPFSPCAVGQMLKRRLETTGLLKILSPRSFRVLVVMDPLSRNVSLEDVQYLQDVLDVRRETIEIRLEVGLELTVGWRGPSDRVA